MHFPNWKRKWTILKVFVDFFAKNVEVYCRKLISDNHKLGIQIMEKVNDEFAIRAARFLKKYMKEIEEDNNIANAEYSKLLNRNHNFIGRLISSHLVNEYYLNKFIAHYYKSSDIIDKGNLSFYQKIYLLPKEKFWWPNFIDGLKEFNSLRNKFAHKLDYSIKANDVDSIKKFVQFFLKEKNVEELDLIIVIEEFTKWAFGF